MTVKLGVIGSAGRRDDARRMSAELYEAMLVELEAIIASQGVSHLVSGGAAFGDHLAVTMFKRGAVSELTLFLPAPFDRTKQEFLSSPRDFGGAGNTTNRYHRAFSKACDIDSLADIGSVLTKAHINVGHGFKDRNQMVAGDVDGLAAFTFGPLRENEPAVRTFTPDDDGFNSHKDAGLKDGGTAHTWGEAWKVKSKHHINLSILEFQLANRPRLTP
ncbi:hypothetical protein ACFOY8_13640 [Thalassospira xianhensis]|uniref:Uncharacterized protein n=1 Tax=Thalassospira xiamenensis TaxID=220697 RepID=A0A285TT21_9PROT|nr:MULTISPECIES: hypothetical protein [Thalassospira]SOC26858.1 hypothetical protein SAMN05428964_105221 [Thalassospira xiamenensis]